MIIEVPGWERFYRRRRNLEEESREERESELFSHLLQIPGRWEVFIERLKTGALEDCAAFYVSNVALLLEKYGNSKSNIFYLK